jgi:eukaryotic-like serine/threonine-protein kinase
VELLETKKICEQCGRRLTEEMPQWVCPHCELTALLSIKEPTTELELPWCFGDYELLEKIGQGGMGVVYKARQLTLNRLVAIKMLPGGQFASESGVQRFLAEAGAAAALQHPNIVAIHEVGTVAGQYFFSMDYVEGRSLATVIQEEMLSFRATVVLITKIAEAIDYAHDHGILHRDLKPANILIDRQSEPHITDFGLAKRLDAIFGSEQSLTVTGQVLGSPGYMPPEQAGGKQNISRGSDVYAIGAIFYELLCRHKPFHADTLLETVKLILETDPLPPRMLNPKIPRELEAICLKCLEKEPARRYETAGELAEDLHRWLDGHTVRARRASIFLRAGRWARRNSLGSAFILFLLMALGISLAQHQLARQ